MNTQAKHRKQMNGLLEAMPLKEMDPALLVSHLMELVGDLEDVQYSNVTSAVSFASYLHQYDTRSNRGDYPVTAYIEHPLRNTIRGMRVGFISEEFIIASLLHDTIEDQPENILKYYALVNPSKLSEIEIRNKAADYIGGVYGDAVKNAVLAVSNPIETYSTPEKKREGYYNHFLSVTDDKLAYSVKLMDLIDNAGSLRHMETYGSEAVIKRAKKYKPVIKHVCDTLFSSEISEDITVKQLSILQRKFDKILRDIENILD